MEIKAGMTALEMVDYLAAIERVQVALTRDATEAAAVRNGTLELPPGDRRAALYDELDREWVRVVRLLETSCPNA